MRKCQRLPHLILASLLLCTSMVSHAADNPPVSDNHQVTIQTTLGDIVVELYPDKAPKTVANFLQYVDDGFYTNTLFHRVIDGFMIQGGGFTVQFEHKPTRAPVMNEADNGLKNLRGTIAMARTVDPQSATSQFYINVADNPNLDFTDKTPRGWGYTVFGKVIKGMEVVDAIKSQPTGPGGPFQRDVPKTPVVILGISRVKTDSANSNPKIKGK
jgi:cyclophilin family peptidyl-prolyl cis-trans isomerase